MVDAKKWLLLAASVLLYAIAFLVSNWFFWTMFVFVIPLYYCALTRKLSFKEGYVYGLIQWPAAGWGVLGSIMNMAHGSWAIKVIPSITICVYEGIFAGIWFWLTNKLITWFKIESVIGQLAVWVATTFLYFIWIVHFSFCIFNAVEGYFLMHPLLPFAEHPALLSLVVPLGKGIVTFLLFVTNALLVLPFFIKRGWYRVSFLAAAILPWLVAIRMSPAPLPVPSFVNKIAVIPRLFAAGFNLNPLAEKLQEEIMKILKKYPETEVIVLPESAINRVNLSTARELGTYWNRENVGKPIHLVAGACLWEKDAGYNSAYWLYDGEIKAIHKKRHAMALTEAVAPWYDFKFVRTLYHPLTPFTASSDPRLPFTFFGDKKFMPYICSELFFNDAPDDTYPGTPILAMCNDSWVIAPYLSHLMLLTARFKAIEWQRDIVYVSYIYQRYVDKNGGLVPLHTLYD